MRQLSEFDEQNYLHLNLDVLNAVHNGLIRSGWDHFYRTGYRENGPGISNAALQKVQAFWSELKSIPLEARKRRAIDLMPITTVWRLLSTRTTCFLNS